jgi:hypothetical protein
VRELEEFGMMYLEFCFVGYFGLRAYRNLGPGSLSALKVKVLMSEKMLLPYRHNKYGTVLKQYIANAF